MHKIVAECLKKEFLKSNDHVNGFTGTGLIVSGASQI